MLKLEKHIKMICLILAAFSMIIFISCDMDTDVKPRNQHNTKWVSYDPNIFFNVIQEDGYPVCSGVLSTSNKKYNIYVDFDYGRSAVIYNYDIIKKNNNVINGAEIIFGADCEFFEDKCILTVTNSVIDNINIGDEIVFNKFDMP